jgi:hypothetical protein
MKEKEYLPPKCIVYQLEHVSCICASTNVQTEIEDFDVDLVEY